MTATLAIKRRIAAICHLENTKSMKAARLIEKIEEKFFKNSSRSVTFARRDHPIREMTEIYSDRPDANWDGYNALPLDDETVSEAKRFI